jgi:hypothetical protein
MNRITALFFAFIFLALSLTVTRAEYSAPDYAAGKQLLAQIQQSAATRKPVLSRPHVFIRSQTKYSGRLYADTYNWHDRPLFANRLLWDDTSSDHKIASFAKTFELYKSYGLDGFASFAWPGAGEYLRTMKPIYDTAAQMKLDPQTFHIMLEVSSDASYLDIDKDTLKLITDNPYSFRVNGKSVISSYVLDRLTPEQLAEKIAPLRERSENKVLILPQIHFIHLKDGDGKDVNIQDIYELYRLHNGELPASLLRAMQEYLRSYARVCDGLYIGPLQSRLDRSADEEFSSQVLAPLFKSVLAEPEFAGKLFALQAKVGYTSYHNSQHLSRAGTKTLRSCFDLAERFRPDLLIGTEWDELNEDTGFEPLVAKPMSSQRIIKYYMSRFKGEAPTPNAGDDLSLPNLIISQRRQILPGVTMSVELLNVPDTAQAQPYTVTLELLDENDKVLYHSQPQKFDSAKLLDHTLNLPSEPFKDARALRPRLTITYRGKQRVLDAGLPFTVVRATTAWDQTWFCTPIRNVLQPQNSDIKFGPQSTPVAGGVAAVTLSANLQSPEKLAYAEVVQDSLESFAYDAQNEYLQNNPNRRLLELSWGYVNNPSRIYINFTADLKDAPSAQTFSQPVAPTTPAAIIPNVKAVALPAFTDNPSRWKQNRYYGAADWWAPSRLISLTTAEMEKAVLTIEGTRATGPHKDEKFSWSLPLKELGEYGVISKVFDDGLVFAAQTQYRPTKLPLPLDAQTLHFQHRIIADSPNGVLALRLVSADGKVFWSKPFAVNATPSKETVPVPVYSSSAKKGVVLAMPKDRVPDIQYDFTPRWGNILHTAAGREYYGHAGSYVSIATGFTGGESAAFATPFYLYSNNIFKGADKPAPDWVEYEPGKWALSFDGERGNFLALPNIAIPQRAGFTLSFDIKPRQVKPEQVLFANEAYSFGTINLSVRDGKFAILFTRRTPDRPDLPAYSVKEFKTNIPLRAGEWQKVVLTYDENKLTLSANGQSESFPFEGIGLYLQQSVFGGRGDRTKAGMIPFYDGLLRSLEIRHYVQP